MRALVLGAICLTNIDGALGFSSAMPIHKIVRRNIGTINDPMLAYPGCSVDMKANSGTQLRLSTISFPNPDNSNLLQSIKTSIVSTLDKIRQDPVLQWRTLAGSLLSAAILFHKSIDRQLAVLWTHLMTSQTSWAARIFRTDSYEWCLAVLCFVVYIHGFWFADRAIDRAAKQGKIHPWRKYRLQDRFEADKARRQGQAKSTGEEASTNFASKESDLDGSIQLTKQSEWNKQAWLFELWVYVLPLLTWDLTSPRRHRRIGGFGAPTTFQIMTGVTVGLLFYDFLFFCGHFLMHKIPVLYRSVHAKHHKVQEVRAGEIVRLSLVEEVLEVGFSIIALNLLSVHPLARSLYNCIITFLLTELHCGFDFPWTPQNVVPFGLATGSRRHHYHHRNGRHYYQKFFFTFDRIFGFFQKDDGTAHGDSVKPSKDVYIPPSWT